MIKILNYIIRVAMVVFSSVNFLFAQGIEIESGATLKASGAATIEITNGSFTNNGTYTKATETVTFSGTTAGTISGSSETDFYNLANTNSGGITIVSTASVTVSNSFSNTGTFSINSDPSSSGSLIVSGTSSGNVTYNRYLSEDRWHIISSPVDAQSISDFLANAANNIAYKDYAVDSFGVTNYIENINDWDKYYTLNSSGNFAKGEGYLMRRETNGVVSFTGTISPDFVKPLYKTSDYGWNSIGNPFTSAIGVNNSATSSANFLNVNTAILDDSFEALYVWDEDANEGSGAYVVVNHAGANIGTSSAWLTNYMQAGQGFIVRASGNGNITFNSQMKLHQPGMILKSEESSWPSIIIFAEKANQKSSTTIAFHESMSNGLDPGYDAGIFKGGTEFNIFTRLIEDNGNQFGLQCLPPEDLQNLEIQIGVDATAGGEIIFKVQKDNFPAEYLPVINDKATNSRFVCNSEEDIYISSVENNLMGFGRFTLTFTNATNTTFVKETRRFKASYKNGLINLFGNSKNGNSIKIYDISGNIIAQDKLKNQNHNTIHLPTKSNGIYIIKIEKDFGTEVIKLPIVN